MLFGAILGRKEQEDSNALPISIFQGKRRTENASASDSIEKYNAIAILTTNTVAGGYPAVVLENFNQAVRYCDGQRTFPV